MVDLGSFLPHPTTTTFVLTAPALPKPQNPATRAPPLSIGMWAWLFLARSTDMGGRNRSEEGTQEVGIPAVRRKNET